MIVAKSNSSLTLILNASISFFSKTVTTTQYACRITPGIQSYFITEDGYPCENSPDEYAFYFEQAYSAEADRRLYIDNIVKTATPSFGHLVLAALLKMDHSKAIWTTYFTTAVSCTSKAKVIA
ncbi:MAG: hypothetical protein ABFD83_06335 [Armatimonadota bacterium]